MTWHPNRFCNINLKAAETEKSQQVKVAALDQIYSESRH
jgi:hypothetical protein